MKLPDFEQDNELNAMRATMGAALREYVPPSHAETLTIEDIERLAGEGIEIPIDEVRVLNDGTHFYKGRRVIVYIRDVAEYSGQSTMPKYHLAMCKTLSNMIERGRYQKRYVVATREDGQFVVQRIRGESIIKSEESLDVCQLCLDQLKFRSFSFQMDKLQRADAVRSFSIAAFFQEYGKSCVWASPRFDDVNAPPNVYSPHFFRIAKTIKENRGYRCELLDCKLDLSAPEHQRYLHAHHKNADKSDNHPTNIQLLCIRCHAKQFHHSHVRENPDYARFCLKFPDQATPAGTKKVN